MPTLAARQIAHLGGGQRQRPLRDGLNFLPARFCPSRLPRCLFSGQARSGPLSEALGGRGALACVPAEPAGTRANALWSAFQPQYSSRSTTNGEPKPRHTSNGKGSMNETLTTISRHQVTQSRRVGEQRNITWMDWLRCCWATQANDHALSSPSLVAYLFDQCLTESHSPKSGPRRDLQGLVFREFLVAENVITHPPAF